MAAEGAVKRTLTLSGALAAAVVGCAQVLAVDEFDVTQPGDAGGGDGAGGSVACAASTDCASLAKPCFDPLCEAGECVVRAVPEGAACGAGARCDASGLCVVTGGQSCALSSECPSGVCEDAVCCAAACGVCATCALPTRIGTCSPEESGVLDATGGCKEARCDGLGRCATGTPSSAWPSTFPKLHQRGYALASRPAGGWLVGGVRFGSDAGFDALLLQLAADGTLKASVSFGAAGASALDAVHGVAVDAEGHGYGVGACAPGTVLPSNPPVACAAQGLADSYVLKLDPDGKVMWARLFDATTAAESLTDVAVRPGGGVAVVGYGGDTSPVGGRRATVALLDDNGNVEGPGAWRRDFMSTSNFMSFSSVALAPDGDILVGGTLRGTATFMGVSLTSMSNSEDAFVVRFDSKGEVVRWARVFGGAYVDAGVNVAVAPNGTVALAGSFAYELMVDKNVWMKGADGNESFVVVLDGGTGLTRWAAPIAGQGDGFLRSVAFDAASNLIVGGYFSGVGATLSLFGKELTPVGSYDGFIAKVTNLGIPLWSQVVGGKNVDIIYDIATTNGNVFAIGSSSSAFMFGSTSLVGDSVLEDAVLFEFAP